MSERKINLEEIIYEYCYQVRDNLGTPLVGTVSASLIDVKEAMKEVCKQTLELAAENVHLNISHETPTSGEYSSCEQSFYFNERCGYKYNVKTDIKINKKSILDTINQIE